MDEKIKEFIKEEVIGRSPINLKDALIGAQYDIEIDYKESDKMYTESAKVTLFAIASGIPKSINEVHKITLFAYNQNTKTIYESLNGHVFYAPLTQIKGIYHQYWAFCYGSIEFDLDEMIEYQEFIYRFNNDKLTLD